MPLALNLFMVAISARPIGSALVTRPVQSIASRVGYFGGTSLREHSSADRRLAAAWICHPPARVGGVQYWALEGEVLALFSGRPILVTDDGFDGAAALDPRLYLRPAPAWEERLDGRFVVVRCDSGREVTVRTDPVGAYRVFTFERDGIRWIGNHVGAMGTAANPLSFDALAAASVLAFGWSFEGRPLRGPLERLGRDTTYTFTAGRLSVRSTSRPGRGHVRAPSTGFDPRTAAETLLGVTDALMEWPERPVIVGVTGGRDSRLTFAAASLGSRPFTAKTLTWVHQAGFPNSPDVSTARALCEAAGVPHNTEVAGPVGDLRTGMAMISLLGAGSVTGGDVGSPRPNARRDPWRCR